MMRDLLKSLRVLTMAMMLSQIFQTVIFNFIDSIPKYYTIFLSSAGGGVT